MKNTFLLTFALILLAGSPLKAQEKEEAATLNKVVKHTERTDHSGRIRAVGIYL